VAAGEHVRETLNAARRLIAAKEDAFTLRELAGAAGIAVTTFYRYFANKDELLLAVIHDVMADVCEELAVSAAVIDDPLARFRYFITSAPKLLDRDGASISRFVISSHWRLRQQFPDELADAEKPLIDLLKGCINDAIGRRLLNPTDLEWDSWFLGELVRSVYHFYAFAEHADGEVEIAEAQLWRFCLTALGAKSQIAEIACRSPDRGRGSRSPSAVRKRPANPA
jgi:AcrR family transcriptional regulator